MMSKENILHSKAWSIKENKFYFNRINHFCFQKALLREWKDKSWTGRKKDANHIPDKWLAFKIKDFQKQPNFKNMGKRFERSHTKRYTSCK